MSFAVPDLGRLARSTTSAATMAARGEVSPTAAASFIKLVERHGRYVDDLSERLQVAHADSRIGTPKAAVAALTDARTALANAEQTLRSSTRTRQRVPLLPFLGSRSDARAGSEELMLAASRLARADSHVRSLPGAAVVDDRTSRYVLRGAELDAARATPHQPGSLDEPSDGVRTMLSFDRRGQTRASRAYAMTAGRLVDTNWHDVHKLEAARHPTLGTLHLGSHMHLVDPVELIAGLRVRGAAPMRALGNDGVVRDFPFLQRMGLFGINHRVGNEVVKAEQLIPTLLDHGTSTLMFQDGALVPLANGAVGEPRRGAALAATRTGAPILDTATYGLQSKVDIGRGAARRSPQTVVGDPLWVRRIDPRATPEQLDEQVWEVTELLAQRHEALQQRAFRAYHSQ